MKNKLRHTAVGVGLGELGKEVRETRPNWGPEVGEYLRNAGINVPAPWCAAFIQWITDRAAKLAAVRNPLDDVVREALVADYVTLGKERGWEVPFEEVDAGDLVCFRFGKGWDHIGIVLETFEDGRFRSLEGNTNDEGSREGYEVAIRYRKVVPGRTMFLRWDEGEHEETA